jgi:hypothetical protein
MSLVLALACSGMMLCACPAFAARKVISIPDPSKIVVEEPQEVLTPEQQAMQERLPIEESENNGYWWNRQSSDAKAAYVKQLIISFKLSDRKLPVKNIVRALDTEYNPRDNPMDIRIDKSVERMFNVVTKEMMQK